MCPLSSSEEVTTSPVTTTEYWNSAPHPQLAHLPQLPHPLNSKVVTVQTTTAKKLPTQTTKIGTYAIQTQRRDALRFCVFRFHSMQIVNCVESKE